MSKHLNLNLLNNGISYFREAVAYAQKDTDGAQWKFAIINVVQSMELAFKEYLRRIHPVFIRESVDKKDKTISMRGALARMTDPDIGNVTISERDKVKIESAVKLRNELTHYEFNHSHEHMELKFAEIFSFMIFFYKQNLGLIIDDFIEREHYQKIINLTKTRKILMQKAREYIESVGYTDLWMCPLCNEDTFIVDDGQCCFCHHEENVIECKSCSERLFESEEVDTSSLFEWDYDEGMMRLMDDYGLEDRACPDCISSLKEKVEEMRHAQYYEDMMMDSR